MAAGEQTVGVSGLSELCNDPLMCTRYCCSAKADWRRARAARHESKAAALCASSAAALTRSAAPVLLTTIASSQDRLRPAPLPRMRLLNVAEKPSVANAIASILGEGRARKVSVKHTRGTAASEWRNLRNSTQLRGCVRSLAHRPLAVCFPRCALLCSCVQRDGGSRYNPVFEFSYSVPGLGDCAMSVTSVAGHLLENEFEARYAKGWASCDPKELFFKAKVIKLIPSVRTHAIQATTMQTTERESRCSHSFPPFFSV